MRRLVPVLTLLLAVPALAEDFRWSGRLAAGKTVEVKGINGDIDARPAGGSEVEVTAVKRGRRSDASEVRVEMVEHERGVTICAVYPSRGGSRPNKCGPGEGSGRTDDNDVEVRFEVRVPVGVNFVGRTVNGGIEAVDLPAEAEAYTVNGSVRVSAAGETRAETVNGSIRASMGRSDGRDPLSFKTVNGGITVELPASTEADVHAETVNGGIETDFPLTVKGKWVGRRIDGQIGAGGRRLELETVNGSITLRKAS
jgi:Putative adhesin